MDETKPHDFLDIEGNAGIHERVAFLKLGAVVLLAVIGWGLWYWAGVDDGLAVSDPKGVALLGMTCWAGALALAASLASCKERYVYLDFHRREIVFRSSRAWWEVGSRRRPLTEFREIVVRHLCHPNPEGEDTYTGSVGLKPGDQGSVVWVKSFPTTQDEVPRDAYEFARKLQAMIGLPLADPGGFRDEPGGSVNPKRP